MAARFLSADRQQTYVGNSLTIDDISGQRKITQAAEGKERIESTFIVKPVKTSKKVKDISQVRLPKGSVAVGEIGLGGKVYVEEPNEIVTYVEVEVPVEEIVYQPKITQQVVEKLVPVYYDEEHIEDVEVDEIVYQEYVTEEFVDKIITVQKPVSKTVERKIPVTLTIPKIIQNEVVKVIEVPSGEIIHKEVRVVKEKINHRTKFVEKHVPIIVSHEITPIVSHDPNIVREVEVTDHYPVITPVDVHIAKPVNVNVRAMGHGEVTHRVVTVPAAHYNTLLKKLNPTLHEDLPLFMEDGVIPMLNQELSFLYPPADAEIAGFNAFESAFSGIKEEEFISSKSKSSHSSSSHSGSSRSGALKGRGASFHSGSTACSEEDGVYSSTYSKSHSSNHLSKSHTSSIVPPKKKSCAGC